MLNQDDQLTLNLLNFEIIGATTAIIGLILFILASITGKEILLSSYYKQGDFRPNLNPDFAAFMGRFYLLIAGFIASGTVTLRLIQRMESVKRHEPMTGSLLPTTFVTIGSWISLIGTSVALVGDYRRLQEPVTPTPIY